MALSSIALCSRALLKLGADTIASFDEPSALVPGKQHSFQKSAPTWWSVEIVKGGK